MRIDQRIRLPRTAFAGWDMTSSLCACKFFLERNFRKQLSIDDNIGRNIVVVVALDPDYIRGEEKEGNIRGKIILISWLGMLITGSALV
jgi:hypothetical protein